VYLSGAVLGDVLHVTLRVPYAFERDIDETLSLMPLALRYRLDVVGLKLSLAPWQRLSPAERRMLAELPVGSPTEVAAARERVLRAALDVGATATLRSLEPVELPWRLPRAFEVVANAAHVWNLPLDRSAWSTLDDEARFVLHHLSNPLRRRAVFRAALTVLGLAPPRAALGIFVGGASRRMGGHPKGLLPAPETGVPLVLRLLQIGHALGCRVTLVGDATAYRRVTDAPTLDDEARGAGPLGGLAALLAWGAPLPVIAVACDMPRVNIDDLDALLEAHAEAHCVAARRDEHAPWEPFFARYNAQSALPVVRAAIAAGQRSLQACLRTLGAVPLTVRAEALDDWDTPADLP
jgi:hypothetical protein